jgi:cytochrome bd-type quinol oxidase subunit 2
MNSIIGPLSLVIAIAAAAFAVYEFFLFGNSPGREGHTNHLWMAIIAAVIACACALIFFVRRVNKEEEIHITS